MKTIKTIIDFRLRPPLKGLRDLRIWNTDVTRMFARLQGIEPAESALQRSMDLLLQDMKESGIGIGVINGRKSDSRRGQVSNEDVLAITRQYPGKFYGLVGANPLLGPDDVSEAERFLRDHGLKGISFDLPSYDEPLYAHERFFPYYELCVKYDCPAALTDGPMGGQDFTHAQPACVDRIADRFPELKIIVAHGCWPYTRELCAVAARRRNVYLMPDMYYFGWPGADDFTAALNSFAADQFLFATAYPSRPLQLTVKQYQELPLKPGVLDKVMYHNAAKLLKLDVEQTAGETRK